MKYRQTRFATGLSIGVPAAIGGRGGEFGGGHHYGGGPGGHGHKGYHRGGFGEIGRRGRS